MKEKRNGWLQILLVVILGVILGCTTFIGFGKGKTGSMQNINLGLDLAGGVSITYEAVGDNVTDEQIADTINKLQKRVDDVSTESAVYKEGSNRINVDIPGAKDANEILKKLGNAGYIIFIKENDLKEYVENPKAGSVVGQKLAVDKQVLYDKDLVIMDGKDIASAKANTYTQGTQTKHVVNLELNSSGTKKFATATEEAKGSNVSIIYDGTVVSSPTVQSAITDGKAEISGQESFEAAEELASTIRIGALPVELKEIRSNVVGAKLGVDAIHTSLLAGVIGFALIIIFMIALYRIPGVAASLALVIYVLATFITFNGFDVTLTLPGIAGVILSIGMAVDANVIIFTRIKEENAAGKSVEAAIQAGFDKALSAIIDGNVTTLIAAAVLWLKGSGTVKGFAQTLAIGIVISMITALFVTKFILKAFYNIGFRDVKFYGVQKTGKTINFTKHMVKFYAISAVLILIGAGALIYNKSAIGNILNYGLDFMGGTSTKVVLNDPITDDTKKEMEKLFTDITGSTPELSEVETENAMVVKTAELSLDQRTKVEEKLIETYGVTEEQITAESISGTVSGEMRQDAVIAVVIATVCMLIYIWIRFKDITFGASAVLALLHDVLVVLMVYAVTRISVGNTFIACMLTIVGYSINATIVIFDRIRENRKVQKKSETLEDVVNASISQTLSRSINTSFTTFIMVAVLFVLGVASMKEFTLPLMAGIICGGYSSICITGVLWYCFKKMGKKNDVKIVEMKK